MEVTADLGESTTTTTNSLSLLLLLLIITINITQDIRESLSISTPAHRPAAGECGLLPQHND